MSLRVYYGDALGAYGFDGHPFGRDRLAAFWNEMRQRGLDSKVEIAAPIACTREELAYFHDAAHIERVQQLSRAGSGFFDEGDTPVFAGAYESACTVVGSVLDAARAVLDGRCARAFVPIAGLHHGRREAASGFCVFNDLGVLIEWLRAEHGLRRIAYIDIDAHHGDGVFYAFEDDPELIFADIHEDGEYLYPGTGASIETGTGAARGTKLNIPLPPGADDSHFHEAWTLVEDFVRGGKPEFVILQAGADSVAGDPLTHLRYSPGVHGYAARRLRALADKLCQGRLIATGGGGYHRTNLAAAWCEVVEALI